MSRLQVLLIDDDSESRNIFRLAVEYCGHDIAMAEDAHTAYDLLKCQHYDIVVVDLTLPDANGLDLAKSIRQQIPGQYKLIATTAYYTDATPSDVRKAGFEGYLQKPVSAVSLGSYLESL